MRRNASIKIFNPQNYEISRLDEPRNHEFHDQIMAVRRSESKQISDSYGLGMISSCIINRLNDLGEC